ncbi:MAG: PocR ligand-binding domain-containing protein [Candidatus Omnitrophica bacterium]|nr:PocR ligand-binding domain-containing protein [Candidatus Omnitrophota bacterium]
MYLWPRKKPIKFNDLVRIEDWQRLQDLFSSVSNIGIYTVDPEGRILTEDSKESRLCKDFIKKSIYGLETCGGYCLPTFLGGKAIVNRNYNFVCPPGFHNFLTPLRINDKVLAYVIMGPVILVMRKPKEAYQQLANDLNVDLEQLWKAIMEIRVISFQRAQTMIELIGKIGDFILTVAYESKRGDKRFLDNYHNKFSELLGFLLKLALLISGADVGSIMLFDKQMKELLVRAAEGLPNSVIQNTRVRVGSGLSGKAVQENRPLLIDEKVCEQVIRERMRRPYIRSSMILPLNLSQKVLGVMNLGALEVSSIRFTNEDLERMQHLVKLTMEALYSPVKEHFQDLNSYIEVILQ